MERTNCVQKANSRRERTTALVILPLAVAVTAHASAIFPTSWAGCTLTVLGKSQLPCQFEINVNQLPSGSAITGAALSTPGPLIVGTIGPTDIIIDAGTVTTLSGPLTQDVPISWDFSASAASDETITDWSLIMAIGSTFEAFNYGMFQTSGSGGTASGSAMIPIVPGGVPAGVQFHAFWELKFHCDCNGEGISLNLPEATGLAFDSADAPTPEPSTMGVIGGGLGLLSWLFRLRKKA